LNELTQNFTETHQGWGGWGPRAVVLVLLLAAVGLTRVEAAFGRPTEPKEKAPDTYTISLPPLSDYSKLDWLVGEWSGKTGDKKPQGDIHLAVSYDLEKRVMVFRESVTLPGTSGIPATSETWMGILTADRASSSYVLRVFSSTGFVTRFRVTTQGSEIQFTPEGGEQPPPGWLFRRLLTRTDTDAMTETVQASPPQKSFFDYFTAKLTRTQTDAAKSK